MKNREIKERYKKIVEENTPNVLPKILEKCKDENINSEVFEMNSKNNNGFKFYKIVLPVVATCMVGIFGIILTNNNSNLINESIVALDVNPSIEMKINENFDVLDLKSINEDGNKIIKDIEKDNIKVDTAIDSLVNSMVENGYIDETKNSILVSVKNKDGKIAQNLKEKITNKIDESLKNKSIEGAILSQNIEKEDKNIIDLSNKYNLSIGKTKLILDILDEGLRNNNNDLVTFEQLKNLTIDELNTITTTKNIQLKGISSIGTASTKEYIGEEEAKKIAFTNSKVNSSNVTLIKAKLDFEEGKFIYEVSFINENIEYEYEIDAKTGTITDYEKEFADKEDLQEIKYEQNKDNLSPDVKNKIEELKRKLYEIDRKDDEIDKKEKTLEEEKKELDIKKEKLEKEIDNLEKNIKDLEYRKENTTNESLKSDLENNIIELENEAQIKENEIDSLKSKIKPLKQKLDELDLQEDNLEIEEKKIKDELNKIIGKIK